ncbi:MAG: phosphatase PAP2 family protein [Simkania negevensis]|nr:phosphatase PAP2 family protein [Simkania negevensis]
MNSFPSYWNIKKLLILPAIILPLLWSWLDTPIRPLWDLIDKQAFYILNRWIHTSLFWQNFWALAGHKMMDWIGDLVMITFFYFYIKFSPPSLKAKRIGECLFTLLILASVIYVVNETPFADILHMARKSPSLTQPDAFRLDRAVEWIKVKDHSKKSFPGDHATTAILFSCMVFYLMGRRLGLLSLVYAIFFSLPRLVVGAHWLTDIALGSCAIAFIASSIAVGSPLAPYCIFLFEKGIKKLSRCKKEETMEKGL